MNRVRVFLGVVSVLWAVNSWAEGGAVPPKKWVIGFSQATTTEPWRLLFNKELRAEAAKHPDQIELLMADGMDDVAKQQADMEEFIQRKVDAILITPKVADGLTSVSNRAFFAGIPVFVLDRDLTNDHYTQFIGGDNREIGRAAGRYAVEYLKKQGKRSAHIVEIWGGKKATPAQDRHSGFAEVIQQEPTFKVVNATAQNDGDWKQDLGYEIMASALEENPQIDLVYAHNDPMAYGAYLAAKEVGREKGIAFLGIDAIPMEGVKWVHDGMLTATFLYKTPGDEGIRQALKLLSGGKVDKRVTLPTMTIDKSNAATVLQQQGLLP